MSRGFPGGEFLFKPLLAADTNHSSTFPSNKSAARPEIRRSLSRAIEDLELMLNEQRFGDDGTSTARSEQAGNRYDKVYEKYCEITHR